MASSPLLTLRYASLQDVAEDLEMLMQCCSNDEWCWEGQQKDTAKWATFVQDPTWARPSDVIGLVGKLTVAAGLNLTCSLLSPAQADGRVEAAVDVSAPSLASERVSKLKTALVERSEQWDRDGIEGLFLFDLLTTAQTLLADVPELTEQRKPNADEPNFDSAWQKKEPASPSKIELSRALFWSHHLKAPSKLKDLNSWCPELRVWGIVRVGWPGYLCFEGETASVDEMVRRVKGLQWHAIQLRVQETHTITVQQHHKDGLDAMEQALLSCALSKGHNANQGNHTDGAKVRTGCDVIEDLGELVERLKTCGLGHDEISGALGIRIRR